MTARRDRGLCFAPPWQGGADNGIDAAEFAGLMAPLGPFEARPQLAVAVSGGADSLCLTLLMHDWTLARGGSLIALAVDHGMRPAAAREAAWVRRQLLGFGIPTTILRWPGGQAAGSLQAAAREARHRLLRDHCLRRGILHLGLGHHLEDQAETFLLRLARGSGLEGLSAMDRVRPAAGINLLRPLLGVSKVRLQATLAARGLSWIEDPTNLDTKFARVRLRRLGPAMAAEGLTAVRLAGTADRLGRGQAAIDALVAAELARHALLHPAGLLHLASGVFAGCAEEVGLRLLARAVTAIGGRDYGPRLARLENLYARLRQAGFRAATLSGCRIAATPKGFWLHRETARTLPAELWPGDSLHWDGRFQVSLGRRPAGRGPLILESLGPVGRCPLNLESLGPERPIAGKSGLPAAVIATFPALRDASGLVAVPHFGYLRPDWPANLVKKCLFAPLNRLS